VQGVCICGCIYSHLTTSLYNLTRHRCGTHWWWYGNVETCRSINYINIYVYTFVRLTVRMLAIMKITKDGRYIYIYIYIYIKIKDNPCYGRDVKSETFCTAAPNCFDSSFQNNNWTRRVNTSKLSAAGVL